MYFLQVSKFLLVYRAFYLVNVFILIMLIIKNIKKSSKLTLTNYYILLYIFVTILISALMAFELECVRKENEMASSFYQIIEMPDGNFKFMFFTVMFLPIINIILFIVKKVRVRGK